MADDFAPGTDVGNPAGFVAGAINEGMGSNAAHRAFSEAGGAMRRQTFQRLYGEVYASVANQPEAMGRDPYEMPSASDLTEWSMGDGGKYATSVNVIFRDVDTGIVGTKQYLYVTDEMHSSAEAQLAAWNDMGDEETEAQYGQKMMGALTKMQYVTVPYGGG